MRDYSSRNLMWLVGVADRSRECGLKADKCMHEGVASASAKPTYYPTTVLRLSLRNHAYSCMHHNVLDISHFRSHFRVALTSLSGFDTLMIVEPEYFPRQGCWWHESLTSPSSLSHLCSVLPFRKGWHRGETRMNLELLKAERLHRAEP